MSITFDKSFIELNYSQLICEIQTTKCDIAEKIAEIIKLTYNKLLIDYEYTINELRKENMAHLNRINTLQFENTQLTYNAKGLNDINYNLNVDLNISKIRYEEQINTLNEKIRDLNFYHEKEIHELNNELQKYKSKSHKYKKELNELKIHFEIEHEDW